LSFCYVVKNPKTYVFFEAIFSPVSRYKTHTHKPLFTEKMRQKDRQVYLSIIIVVSKKINYPQWVGIWTTTDNVQWASSLMSVKIESNTHLFNWSDINALRILRIRISESEKV